MDGDADENAEAVLTGRGVIQHVFSSGLYH